MIRLYCKCSVCKGRKKLGFDAECHYCNGTGKTVMVFKSVDSQESVLSETYPEINGKHKLVRYGWSYDVYDENNTSMHLNKSLNPLYLEVIDLQECPECEGKEIYQYIDQANMKDRVCPNCTDGKVEKIVGKYIFNPKDVG